MNLTARITIGIILIMCVHSCLKTCEANASTDIEVVGGGLTYHILDAGAAPKYSNRLTSDGRLIYSSLLGVTATDHYSVLFRSFTAFIGNNSIAEPIFGGLYEEGFEVKRLQVGIGLGAYSQENVRFTQKGIQPYRLVDFHGVGIVPIVGLVFNYRIPLTTNTYIKINNLVSPILTNTSLSLGLSY